MKMIDCQFSDGQVRVFEKGDLVRVTRGYVVDTRVGEFGRIFNTSDRREPSLTSHFQIQLAGYCKPKSDFFQSTTIYAAYLEPLHIEGNIHWKDVRELDYVVDLGHMWAVLRRKTWQERCDQEEFIVNWSSFDAAEAQRWLKARAERDAAEEWCWPGNRGSDRWIGENVHV